MKLITEYTIVLQPDDNGTFVAYIPAIPGCHAWGQTPDEARVQLVNVFDMIQEEYEQVRLHPHPLHSRSHFLILLK